MAVEHLLNADGTIVPMIWDFYLDTEIVVECSYESAGYLQRGFFQNGQLYSKADGSMPLKAARVVSIGTSNIQGTQNGRAGMILTKLSSQQNTNLDGFIQSDTISHGIGSFGNRGALGESVPILSDYGGLV